MQKALSTAVLIAALPVVMGSPAAFAAECGSAQIADMGWNSASLIANVDRFILEHGYGCDATLVPGDTMPTGTSMVEKGEPDIAPEMWSNSLKEALDKGVAEGRLLYAGHSLSDGGEEGFWVPSYMVEKFPELKTIEGVKAMRSCLNIRKIRMCPLSMVVRQAGTARSPPPTCSMPWGWTTRVSKSWIRGPVPAWRVPWPRPMNAVNPGLVTTGHPRPSWAVITW